jgi:alpha-methylacyl-CoA racemase
MAAFYGMLEQGTWRDRRQDNVVDGGAHYYRVYETADGEHFSVGAIEPQFYAELCARLGVEVPHAEDDHEAWAAHGDVMAARFRERTRAEWEADLVTPQACAAPVLSLAEAPRHPQNVARSTFVEIEGVVQPAPAPRFSRTVPPTPGRPALPGDQTGAVLADLGVTDAAVQELLAAGVVRQSTD